MSTVLFFRQSSYRLVKIIGSRDVLSDFGLTLKHRLPEDHPLKKCVVDQQSLVWSKKYLLLPSVDTDQDQILVTVWSLDNFHEEMTHLRHDLKNHIHTIQGYYSLLGLDKLNFSTSQQDYHYSMGEEIKKITKFVNNLSGLKLLSSKQEPN